MRGDTTKCKKGNNKQRGKTSNKCAEAGQVDVSASEDNVVESQLFGILSGKLKQGGRLLSPCCQKILRKLEHHLTDDNGINIIAGDENQGDPHDGDKIRRKIQEEKSVGVLSLQNIKTYFAWVLTSSADDTEACSVAMKFLRVFIDLLEATSGAEADATIAASDLVINVLQYYIILGVLTATGKFIAMLHHVAKHFYKKQNLVGINAVVGDVVDFIHVASDCDITIVDESQRSFMVIHQMSYSVYYKELQKLLKPEEGKGRDVTTLFELRIASLIVLCKSGWKENKFLEHVLNFVNKESALLMQSTVTNKELVANSLVDLIKVLSGLIEVENLTVENNLINTAWKCLIFYVDFCSRHRLATDLQKICPTSTKSFPKELREGIFLLDMSANFCSQLQGTQCVCACSAIQETKQYPSHFTKHLVSFLVNQKSGDTSRMFDVLNLLKVHFKDVERLCGGVINVLLEVAMFATCTLNSITSLTEQKNTTIALLSFVCSLFLHIKVQLFSESANSLQCYTRNQELMSSFNALFQDFIAVLRLFLTNRRNSLEQEDFKWLVVVVYKVGVHYYNSKQYTLAAGSLKFAIFLCELRDMADADAIFMGDLMKRYNVLAECHAKNEDHKEVFQTYAQSILCFEKMSPEHLEVNRLLLEEQVKLCTKKKISMIKKGIEAPELKKCLVDEITPGSGNNLFVTIVLECEYHMYKDCKLSAAQPLIDKLFRLRKQHYEECGHMLEYALCMIEMSTCLSFPHKERYEWCTEAVGLVEEFHENCDDDDDELKWGVSDVLAVGYFHLSIIRYEEEVLKSMEDIENHVSTLIDENSTTTPSIDKKTEFYAGILEEDYEDKQFITYLNEALLLWTKITEHCMSDCCQTSRSRMFHNAEGAAKCLYQAAVFYSLLSQNLNSAKASYLSGVIYQMLSVEGDHACQEKQVASWALTASQFLLIKNVSSGEEILQLLRATRDNSVCSALHIEVLGAAYMLYNGEVQSSAESFREILSNEVLNENTKLSLVIKSDIYFLLSYLKLIPLKEDGEIHEVSQDDHFPSKSPFPPISDCLKYLRSLYSKYVEGASVQGSDAVITSNWAYLDKLLVCLTRNAELLKHQGSLLEAKSLLKEALHLTHKFRLSLRTVEILQQLASMELILKSEKGFEQTFSIISTILQPTVQNCFSESELMLPFFVNHDPHCNCHYCTYPKLQEIHIVLFLQYIESRQYFSQLTSEQYDAAIELIDVLVENAYSRYIGSLNEVYRIMSLSFLPAQKQGVEEDQRIAKTKKFATKGKSKAKESKQTEKEKGEKELFNVFLQYSFEAKMNQSFSDGRNMMESLEQLISKVQISNGYDQTHHEYHRLCAQLYHLRSLLCLDGEVVENMWSSQNNTTDVASKSTQAKRNSSLSNTSQDKKLRGMNCNLITEDTPLKPARRVKQKTMRKGRLYTDQAEAEKSAGKRAERKGSKTSNEASILKCLDDLRQSLTILNPYTDTLIIKAIYQLLILLSGTSNKGLTIACHLLSSSRILHQQMLSACTRKLKDKKQGATPPENKDKELLETTSDLLEKFSDPKLVFDEEQVQYLMSEHIPPDWCVCSLSLSELDNKRFLIICRLQRSKEPIVMKINLSDKPKQSKKDVANDVLAAFDAVDVLEKFNAVMDESEESMKITETKKWWAERVRLDKELKSTITRLEDDWLQGWKGMLLGQCSDIDLEERRNVVAGEVCGSVQSAIGKLVDRDLTKCLLDGFEFCTRYQVLDALQTLYGEKDAATAYDVIASYMEKGKYNENKAIKDDEVVAERRPVVLVLDKTLQKLPWESMNILRGQAVTRMPSLLVTSSHCKNYIDEIVNGITINKCSYVLNPKDDLKRTEEKFSDWFRSQGWEGIVGRPPTSQEYSDAISNNDLFIYCGHGSGQEYLGWSSVNRLQSHAVALLMGCSSGKLLVQGELEAHGMVHYYLSAGCPAVVANLWHVTDRDIDLFLEKLIQVWMTESQGTNLAHCVAKAREACKLEYMNGAAPVVYGLPLFIKE